MCDAIKQFCDCDELDDYCEDDELDELRRDLDELRVENARLLRRLNELQDDATYWRQLAKRPPVTTPAWMDSPKVYICNRCHRIHRSCPMDCETSMCTGKVKAAKVCPICDQWAWAEHTTDGKVVYRCLNDHIDGQLRTAR